MNTFASWKKTDIVQKDFVKDLFLKITILKCYYAKEWDQFLFK